jgi:hypothetical protein
MTAEKIRDHIESDMKVWESKKSELWKMKDQKLAGSKTSWKQYNIVCSAKVQCLQDLLIFIDTNNSKS